MIVPSDYGLPEKFTEFRTNQFSIAARVANSTKYAFLLDAPTGSGKSLIAATVQRLIDKKITYICTTKQLQDQLLSDFPYAKTLKGRGNYVCAKYPSMFPTISADECTDTEANPCAPKHRCAYLIAKGAALNADLAVLNTAYFLSEANFVGGFSNRDFLVIDEFDTTEDQLMNYVELVITQKQLTSLNIDPPRYKTKFESWVEWAEIAAKQVSAKVEEIQLRLDSPWATESYEDIKVSKRLSKLLAKLRFFIKEVDKTWVWYPSSDRWAFKPVWVSKYSSATLWSHSKRILGMSATILDVRQASVNVGLKLSDVEYKILPSPFPKEHRTVYYNPCANVINKNMNVALPMLKKSIISILEKHPDEKILLHTVSYKIRDYLMNSLPKGRLVTHSVKDRAIVLSAFKKSNLPLVLVSPSMDRGVDLPDEECRVVIIAKMPYPDLGDPQVSKRVHASKDGNNWYAYKTVSKVIQMSGRAVRSEDDYATTYILDDQFGKTGKTKGQVSETAQADGC